MDAQFPPARTHAEPRLSRFLAKFRKQRAVEPGKSPGFSRAHKFVSYYRPHLPLLLADLACAVLVAGTAVALPLCANYVTTSLLALSDGPEALRQIWLVGAIMLAITVVQALAIYFVDYQGHVMGAKIEGVVRQELFEHGQ
jgi:ATP-binding cassette subfamily B protein